MYVCKMGLLTRPLFSFYLEKGSMRPEISGSSNVFVSKTKTGGEWAATYTTIFFVAIS